MSAVERAPSEWFEDEAFWRASYPFMFPGEMFAAAAEEVEKVVALTGSGAGTVLDLACGPGRHAVPLARRGARVTGVDSTAFLLAKARAYAEAEGVEVEWRQEDMRSFVRPGAYDLVLSLFTSFGYFDDPAENRAVLENARASLKEDGALVVDVRGKEMIARDFEVTGSREVPGVGLVVERRAVTHDWSRMANDWILIEDGTATRFQIRHWIYSGAELEDLLLGVGFGRVDLYGSLDGEPYGPEAKRLIAVARRSG